MSSHEPQPTRISYFSDDEARLLLLEHFGIDATLRRLPGYVDQTYRICVPEEPGWVLKISPEDESAQRLEMQNQALNRIAGAKPSFGIPIPAPNFHGDLISWARDSGGRRHALRLLSYLPGQLLATAKPRSAGLMESLGETLASLHSALDGLEHPAAHQESSEWDVTRASDVVSGGLSAVVDSTHRVMLKRICDHFEAEVLGHLSGLPSGIIHGDANDHNVVVSPPRFEGRRVTGLLDFGDMAYGPLVADLAIAAAYGCLGTGDMLVSCANVVRGYVKERPLCEAEANLLFPLIRGRLATSVVNSEGRSDADREDPYLSISEAPAWAAIEAFDTIHPRFARALLRDAAGHPACPNSVAVVRWLGDNRASCGPIVGTPLTAENTLVFDVSPSSLEVGRLDRVLNATATTEAMFGRMDRENASVGVGRYGEPRLWYASDDYAAGDSDFPERRTVHTAVDLFMRPGAPLFAPMDATVHSFRDNDERLDYGPTIILEHAPEGGPTFWTLYGHLTEDSLGGLSVGMVVAKGVEFARIGDFPTNGDWAPHLHFQLITDLLGQEATFPGVCRPSQRSVWTSFSPDPGIMVDFPAGTTYLPLDAPTAEAAGRLPEIVRGWRQYLYTEDGQAWLDCVGNACHIGHSHPRVVEAAAKQMAVLNTHTGYPHPKAVQYAQRLAATFPEPLEVCLFTPSGREATELAHRIAESYADNEPPGGRALYIADEAHLGLGRVGTHLWAFESGGLVPDLVTMGESMGNGHPMGAVMTTREIAGVFLAGTEMLPRFVGDPLSCAVGMAVLDVIEEEALQVHALSVGDRLKAGLSGLILDCPAMRKVRGRGLFLELEFGGRDSGNAGREIAAYLVSRMRQHGILLGTDDAEHHIIRIKPPMVFSAADADRVIEAARCIMREDFVRLNS